MPTPSYLELLGRIAFVCKEHPSQPPTTTC